MYTNRYAYFLQMLQETAELKSLGLMNENVSIGICGNSNIIHYKSVNIYSSNLVIFFSLQLLTVHSSVLERSIGGCSNVMQPSECSGNRPLTALVLHTVTVILNQRNALLEPFVNILIHPSLIKVNISDYVFSTHSNLYNVFLLHCLRENIYQQCLKTL